jgi:predicted metal-dependent peptidase
MSNDNASSALKKASFSVICKSSFFGSLLLRMPRKENKDIPTMMTEGVNIYYNPEFVSKLSMPHIKFILLHEVFHAAFGHCNPFRVGMRDKEITNPSGQVYSLWNIAADYANNYMLNEFINTYKLTSEYVSEKESIDMPPQAYYDKRFANMNVEAIYDILEKEIESNNYRSCNNGKLLDDHDISTQNKSETECNIRQQEWNKEFKLLIQKEISNPESLIHKNPNLVEILNGLSKERVNWRSLLANEIDKSFLNDFSYSKPNKNYIDMDIYLPGLISNHVNIIIAVDVSGSMHPYLSNIFNEIDYLISMYTSISIRLIEWDSCVLRDVSYDSFNDITLDSHLLGGSTAIQPVIELLNETCEGNTLVIMITDGCTVDAIPSIRDNMFRTIYLTPEEYIDNPNFKDNIVIPVNLND